MTTIVLQQKVTWISREESFVDQHDDRQRPSNLFFFNSGRFSVDDTSCCQEVLTARTSSPMTDTLFRERLTGKEQWLIFFFF
jgi:hypothetical protein